MRIALPSALLAVVVAGSVGADEVYLTNGKVFEDVTAKVVDDQVAIGLPSGGEIKLSLSHVERIERAETTMAVFRERAEALLANPVSPAAEWLDLAYWARSHDLERAYREAALEAARRNPTLPGVSAAMRELGYEFDDELGEWLPRDQAMLRRGLVPHSGAWVTPDERERLVRAADERARQREQDERLDRLTRLVELQTEIEVARGLAEAAQPQGYGDPYYADYYSPYYPVYLVPGQFFGHAKLPTHHGGHQGRGPRVDHHGHGRHDGPPRHSAPSGGHHHGGMQYFKPVAFTDSIPGRLNPGAAPPPGQLRTPPRSSR